MANLACLDHKAKWVHPVPWVHLVLPAQKVPWVFRVLRVSVVIRVVMVPRVCVGRRVTKVQLVARVREAHEDQQALLEVRDLVVLMELTEWSARPVLLVPQGLADSLEKWDLLVLSVRVAPRVHVVLMALLDLLGLPVNLASLEPPVSKGYQVVMERKGQRVNPDCEVLQGLRVLRAHEVFLVLLELLEKLAKRVQSVFPDLLALLDLPVTKVIRDLSDPEGPLAHLVQWVQLEHAVHVDVPDRRVQWVRQVPQGLQELLEMTVVLDSRELLEDRGPADVLVHAVKLVLLGLTVLMVKLVS